ncbi:MAG: hypothetical protein FJX76_20335 [Armatimonadetes bacterium]|nr:hypothetical protein [Armatimonadota bacterium]
MVVPRFDLAVSGTQLAAVLRRVASGRAAAHPEQVAEFQSRFASWLGVEHAIFLPSARSGLYLILKAAEKIGRAPQARPEVLVPAWTHASVPAVVEAAGWRPRYLDCDVETMNSEPRHVPADAWDSAWAAIATHLYGTPCDAEAWVREARGRGMFVIEDCAQALGARLRGRRAGTFADASYFSFAVTKNFTTLGGGMVATNDDELAGAIREMISGSARGPLLKPAVMGMAFRLATNPTVFSLTVYPGLRLGWAMTGRDLLHEAFDEPVRFQAPLNGVPAPYAVQSWLGTQCLPGLDPANARRAAAGRGLHAALRGTPGVGLPSWPADSEPIFMSLLLRVPRRMKFMHELLKRGVDTSPGYLRACNPQRGACPTAESVQDQQVHLPVYARLSDAEVKQVADAVRAVAAMLGVASEVPVAVHR